MHIDVLMQFWYVKKIFKEIGIINIAPLLKLPFPRRHITAEKLNYCDER